MLNGWLIYNGTVYSEKLNILNNMYITSAKGRGIKLYKVKNNEIHTIIENNKTKIITKENLPKPDFILFLNKDTRLAFQFEKLGYKVFNSAKTIKDCDDKMTTFQILADNGVKMPKTISAPLIFYGGYETSDYFIDFIEGELKYPIIIKEVFGSFGMEVFLVNNREELIKKREELLHKPHLYQEFVKTSKGRDVRINVVGNKVVASMLRVSNDDFRANVVLGASAEKFEAPKEFNELAVKASNLMGADFSGVDILFGENDEPIICEVNSNSHITGIYKCTKINVANYIFDYIIEKIKYME